MLNHIDAHTVCVYSWAQDSLRKDILISMMTCFNKRWNKTWRSGCTQIHTVLVGPSDVLIQSSESSHCCHLHEEGRLLSWNPFHRFVVAGLTDMNKHCGVGFWKVSCTWNAQTHSPQNWQSYKSNQTAGTALSQNRTLSEMSFCVETIKMQTLRVIDSNNHLHVLYPLICFMNSQFSNLICCGFQFSNNQHFTVKTFTFFYSVILVKSSNLLKMLIKFRFLTRLWPQRLAPAESQQALKDKSWHTHTHTYRVLSLTAKT